MTEVGIVKAAVKCAGIGALGVALGFGGGLLVGYRQGLIGGLRHLEDTRAEVLSLDVEAASCLRAGDAGRALELLDLRLDGAIVSLAAAQENLGFVAAATEWDPARALGVAKVYRGLVPPSGHDAAAVQSALAKARVLNPRPLSPGLAKLVRQVGS